MNEIINGDAIEVLRTLFEEYVDEKMLRLRLRMFEDVKEDAE